MKFTTGLGKYVEISKVNFYNSIHYVLDTLGHGLFIVIIIAVLTAVWRTIFMGQDTINGFTLAMMIWYICMGESIASAQPAIINDISNDIKTGDIAHYLNKPYNYLLYRYALSMGSTLFRATFTLLLCCITALLLVGPITLQLSSLPFVLLAVFLAVTLDFACLAIIGSLSFWMEDAKGIGFIYQKMVFIAGGMLVPLFIFPEYLQNILGVLPSAGIVYLPSKLFVDFSFDLFKQTIIFQSVWILIAILSLSVLFFFGSSKVEMNGG